MKAVNKAIAVAALSCAPMMASAVEVSANVGLTTDYRFRGISQTDNEAALQGGFDIAFDSGFYVGTWGSNVDFANSLELDYYVGFGGEISESLSYDLGYIYYDYPGTDGDDPYQEFYGSLSFGDLTLGAAYSNDYYFETGEFYYLYGDYGFDLGQGYNLGLHYGYNSFDEADTFLSKGDDYSDWSVAISKEFAGIEVSLSYVDTDLDESECFGTDWCDATAVLAISKSF